MLDKSISSDASDSSIAAAAVVRMYRCAQIGESIVRIDVLAGLLAGDDDEFRTDIMDVIEAVAEHPEGPIQTAVGGGSVELAGDVDASVSIPLWVFSLLRQRELKRRISHAPCFNPVVGFLPAATEQSENVIKGHFVSIPLWVFSLLRQLEQSTSELENRLFQSRCGFSPCCDVVVNNQVKQLIRVSIPLWVFSLLRRS